MTVADDSEEILTVETGEMEEAPVAVGDDEDDELALSETEFVEVASSDGCAEDVTVSENLGETVAEKLAEPEGVDDARALLVGDADTVFEEIAVCEFMDEADTETVPVSVTDGLRIPLIVWVSEIADEADTKAVAVTDAVDVSEGAVELDETRLALWVPTEEIKMEDDTDDVGDTFTVALTLGLEDTLFSLEIVAVNDDETLAVFDELEETDAAVDDVVLGERETSIVDDSRAVKDGDDDSLTEPDEENVPVTELDNESSRLVDGVVEAVIVAELTAVTDNDAAGDMDGDDDTEEVFEPDVVFEDVAVDVDETVRDMAADGERLFLPEKLGLAVVL